MKKLFLILLLISTLYSAEFFNEIDPNLRVNSSDSTITYSTRLNLILFERSKIIAIIEQSYDTSINAIPTNYKYTIKYIYYW